MIRRLRRQIVTHEGPQVRFALRALLLTTLVQVVSFLVAWAYVSIAVKRLAVSDVIGLGAMDELARARQHAMLVAFLWSYPANVLVTLWWGLRVSHRFYGVMVPVTRLLDELGEGRFGREIALRNHDELGDLRDAVNRLSRNLAQRAPQGETP